MVFSSVATFSLFFEGHCDYAHIVSRINLELQREEPSCPHGGVKELQLLLGISNNNEAAAKSHVREACSTAFNTQYQMMWKEVTQKATLRNEPLFDKTYYDGGSIWNEQYETGVDNRVPYVNQRYANVLKYDGSRIDECL